MFVNKSWSTKTWNHSAFTGNAQQNIIILQKWRDQQYVTVIMYMNLKNHKMVKLYQYNFHQLWNNHTGEKHKSEERETDRERERERKMNSNSRSINQDTVSYALQAFCWMFI